jgi:hypothetical protein
MDRFHKPEAFSAPVPDPGHDDLSERLLHRLLKSSAIAS